MKRASLALIWFSMIVSSVLAQSAAESSASTSDGAAQVTTTTTTTAANHSTQAAAALHAEAVSMPRTPDLLEQFVDTLLEAFDVRTSENTWQHYAIAGALLIVFFLLRRAVAHWVFGLVRSLTSRTRTTFDDRLTASLEAPAGTAIALVGIFAALKVLKLSPTGDEVVRVAMTVAFSVCFFWGVVRALAAFLDHLTDVAKQRKAGVAAFMPWIKKTLVSLFVVLAVLMIAQSLGANVKAFLAGLGLGGLAFALAAQDTIANLFGSIVVAVDQPFKLGEFVKIGNFAGAVEDIGLRSTRLRAADKSLIVIPNKTVAAEAVTNLARFTQRRAEQVIGLTYDTPPEQMEAIVEEFKQIILAEPHVDPASVMVYFRDYSASSLDIWMVYMTKDADFPKHMTARQRINLAIMRAVQARGLSFAFPTQTVELGESTARLLNAPKDSGDSAPAQG